MIDKNTSHLAGEFLVAGELARRGYPVSITMGNAKAIDIHADTLGRKKTIRIDAKATRSKTSWPISEDAVEEGIFYIFVNLRTEKEIKEKLGPLLDKYNRVFNAKYQNIELENSKKLVYEKYYLGSAAICFVSLLLFVVILILLM